MESRNRTRRSEEGKKPSSYLKGVWHEYRGTTWSRCEGVIWRGSLWWGHRPSSLNIELKKQGVDS
jgi:hypothetical protein